MHSTKIVGTYYVYHGTVESTKYYVTKQEKFVRLGARLPFSNGVPRLWCMAAGVASAKHIALESVLKCAFDPCTGGSRPALGLASLTGRRRHVPCLGNRFISEQRTRHTQRGRYLPYN